MSSGAEEGPTGPGSASARVEIRLSGAAEPVGASLDAAFLDGSKLDDSYLVRRAQQGSTEAFEVLVHRYRARVFRVALRLVGEPASAEDVAQDALVSAWRALPEFRRDAAFSTWLHRIVVNSALNVVTRHRLTDELSDDPPISTSQQPERVVESRAREEALRSAIRELPFDQRAPLVMYQFEGFSYEQTAEILQISVSTVRGRIARARRALLDSMREWR